jgi:hypothetical protein
MEERDVWRARYRKLLVLRDWDDKTDESQVPLIAKEACCDQGEPRSSVSVAVAAMQTVESEPDLDKE